MMKAIGALNNRLDSINDKIGYGDSAMASMRESLENCKASLADLHAERDDLVAAIAKLQEEPGAKQ